MFESVPVVDVAAAVRSVVNCKDVVGFFEENPSIDEENQSGQAVGRLLVSQGQ